MQSKIIKEKISKEELVQIAEEVFGNMVKVDIDIRREILTAGGEWHSEGDDILVKDGSSREDVWGVNFYPWNKPEDRIEYNSLINIKPSLNHKDMEIRDKKIKEQTRKIIQELLLGDNETLDV